MSLRGRHLHEGVAERGPDRPAATHRDEQRAGIRAVVGAGQADDAVVGSRAGYGRLGRNVTFADYTESPGEDTLPAMREVPWGRRPLTPSAGGRR